MKTFLNAQWPEKLSIASPVLASASKWLVLVLLAWWSGAMVVQSLQTVQAPTLPKVAPQQSLVTPKGDPVYLFGKPEVKKAAKPVKKPVENKNTSVTRLNLKLIGMIGIGEEGVALIEVSNKTKVVAVGETVQSGVTLVNVLTDGVILDNRGKHEKLLLKKFSKSNLIGKREPRKTETRSDEAETRLSSSQQKKLDSIGKKLKKQPMTISRYIRFKPINSDGTWTGVKLWSKKDKKLFRDLGFQEGDILKEVNGKSIQDMASHPDLWKKFLSQSSFDLVVERNGALENISVNFN